MLTQLKSSTVSICVVIVPETADAVPFTGQTVPSHCLCALTVFFLSVCVCVSLSEPQIKRHPNNVTLMLDSKAVLPCVTLGNPKPDISWIKDDGLVKVGEVDTHMPIHLAGTAAKGGLLTDRDHEDDLSVDIYKGGCPI